MPDVFISYARADQALARRVAKALQAAGLDVWWDADLPAHRAYSEVIERNLEAAKAVVVLWSKTAAKSQWVRAEADFARNAGTLVQAQVDGTLPPMPFNQIQCADLNGWKGGASHPGWAKLKHSVEALVSGEESPIRSPDRPTVWERVQLYRWWMAAGVALLVVAAALLMVFDRPTDERRPVLAVLPFESLDARDASLVAGIWEDTRQMLSRNPQLLVLGPNSSQELADEGNKAATKAADYLLEASVRTAGDRVRVSTSLVRTKDGAQMWSESFDRRLDDVFALQSEIAREIEGKIRGRLANSGGILPQNIATSGEVYALYSDARVKVRGRQMQKYDEALEQLRQVVQMDPNFAPGWATLSVVKSLNVSNNEPDASTAGADARRAISLAPNLAAGHAALGFALGFKGPVAQAALRRATQLDPNDIEALNWFASSLDRRTQSNAVLQIYSRIVEIEPLWWPAVLNRINLLFELENSAAVEQELRRVEGLRNRLMSTVIKMELLKRKGDLSAAVDIGLAYYRVASPGERELMTISLFQPLLQLGLFDIADQISPAPPQALRVIPLVRANDARAIDMLEQDFPPRRFWTSGPLPIVGSRVYLLNNQGPRLAKQYRAVAATPEEFESLVGATILPDIAPSAALALKSAGDADQARRLLELAEKRLSESDRDDVEQQVRRARIYAVQGKNNEAIGLLSSAIRLGWLPPYLPIHTDIALDPPLNELRVDPRFEQSRQQILGHLKKERAELGPVRLEELSAASP